MSEDKSWLEELFLDSKKLTVPEFISKYIKKIVPSAKGDKDYFCAILTMDLLHTLDLYDKIKFNEFTTVYALFRAYIGTEKEAEIKKMVEKLFYIT